MKSLLTWLVSGALVYNVSAQSPTLVREVIASGGDYFATSSGSLSWTLGESFTETVESNSLSIVLTQGFQQPDELPVGIRPIADAGLTVSLFPNPATKHITLNVSLNENSSLKVELLDMLGRILQEGHLDMMKGQTTHYQADVSALAAGMYMLKLTDGNRQLNSYKFQKIAN